MNIAVIPPSQIIGSLGDQMMLKSIINTNDTYFLTVFNDFFRWKLFAPEYGDNVISHNELVKLPIDLIYGIGADVIDGRYSTTFLETILHYDQHWSKPIRIVSCSFNENPSIKAVNIINSLTNKVSFYLRDEYSYNRFKQRFPNKEAYLSADVGFLLKEEKHNFNLKDDVPYVVCNAHDLAFNGDEITSEIIKNVDYPTLLIQHDHREGHNEGGYLRVINNVMDDTIFIDEQNTNKLKSIYDYVEFCITARMHIAITALSKGVPTIGFEYQDKMHGIFKKFGVEELVCNKPSELGSKLSLIDKNYEKYEEKIIDSLPKVINELDIIWKF